MNYSTGILLYNVPKTAILVRDGIYAIACLSVCLFVGHTAASVKTTEVSGLVVITQFSRYTVAPFLFCGIQKF